MSDRAATLGLRTAWRTFEQARGASPSVLDAGVAALEARVQGLNLEPDSVHLACEIAALEPNLSDDSRLALVTLVVCSLVAQAQGSTRLPVTGPEGEAALRAMLGALIDVDGVERGEAERRLDAMRGVLARNEASTVIGCVDGEYRPLLLLGTHLYHQRTRITEIRLARGLARLLERPPIAAEENAVRAALADVRERPFPLSEDQIAAIAAASRFPLTLITGGPGTGKTSIVVAILRLLARLGVAPDTIALSAPTGKAAYRLGESISAGLAEVVATGPADEMLRRAAIEPVTLHRLLGASASGERFRHHRGNPLAASVVVVDEGSMLDLVLMERLVGALRPDARLVILGDADQLPPVSAGAVFRDLVSSAATIEPLAAATIRLLRSYRVDAADASGRAILSAAGKIRDGATDLFDTDREAIVARRAEVSTVLFDGVEQVGSSEGELGAFLDLWERRRILGDPEVTAWLAEEFVLDADGFGEEARGRLERIFRHIGASRILCATRVLETGADRINRRLHARAAERAGVSAARMPFLPGEPVIMLRNDYVRRLFNGDQGIVLRVKRPGEPTMPMAVFPRPSGFMPFRLETVRGQVDLCYAMTVHKAQGSEFDGVAVVLPGEAIPLLTREILYTAVSRARRSVVIVGDEALVRTAIAHRVERSSGLAEQLGDELVSARAGYSR